MNEWVGMWVSGCIQEVHTWTESATVQSRVKVSDCKQWLWHFILDIKQIKMMQTLILSHPPTHACSWLNFSMVPFVFRSVTWLIIFYAHMSNSMPSAEQLRKMNNFYGAALSLTKNTEKTPHKLKRKEQQQQQSSEIICRVYFIRSQFYCEANASWLR